MNGKTRKLTESAMLIAIAIVLELVSKLFIPEFTFGGQITLMSMLPVVLISYRHGMKWGFVAAFTYSLLQMALGAKTVSGAFLPGYFGDGVMLGKALLMCLLDYTVAFTALGLGGSFRDKLQSPGKALAAGSVVALLARYVVHILSGYILFADYAEWFFSLELFQPWGGRLLETLEPGMLGFVYSVCYNGCYMIPEILLTAAGALIIARIPGVAAKQS